MVNSLVVKGFKIDTKNFASFKVQSRQNWSKWQTILHGCCFMYLTLTIQNSLSTT